MVDADPLDLSTAPPHDHGDGGELLLRALDDEGREAVLRGNAAEFYRLEG